MFRELSAAVDVEPEKQPEPIQKNPEKQPTEVETAKEKNFAALRQKAERAERERDEYFRRLQNIEQSQPRVKQELVEVEEDFSIAPDDLVEGKHVAKLYKELKQVRQEMQNYKHQTVQVTDETRVRSEMPDYDKVVSEENIELLKSMEPDLAESIASNPNLYSKAKAAYRAIKKSGIHVDDIYSKERAIVEKNMAKPRTLTSVSPQQGNSPLSHANAFAAGLTPELEEQLRREMAEATRNR